MNLYNSICDLSEKKINQVSGGNDTGENKTKTINCYYRKNTGLLEKYGSSSSCPTSYSDFSDNPHIKLIEEIQDRVFNGVTLTIPIEQ
jgi:hypothetical protein